MAAQEGTEECLAIFQDIFGRSFLARLRAVKGQSPHKMLAMLMEAHDRGQLTFFNTHAGLAEKRTFKVLRHQIERHHLPLGRWMGMSKSRFL